MEEIFQPEIVQIFSGGFLSISCAFRQEPVGNHRKKSENQKMIVAYHLHETIKEFF